MRVSRAVCNPSGEGGEARGFEELQTRAECRPVLKCKVHTACTLVIPHQASIPSEHAREGTLSFFLYFIFLSIFQNIIISWQVCRWEFPKPRLRANNVGVALQYENGCK